MKNFNPKLNKDIIQLSALHSLKDKSKFNALKNEIMLKHSLSKATVYREMKKETPGLYKNPCYSPPHRAITEKEIAMVKELLLKKIPVMDLARIVESETGNKCTWDRIDKIRSIIDARFRADENKTYLTEPIESSFGENVKRLCEEALKCNYMPENSTVTFTAGDNEYRLCFADVKNIALICSNAAARNISGMDDYVTFAREKIWALFMEKLIFTNSGKELSTKELIDIKNAYEEFEKNHTDIFLRKYSVFYYVAQELRPEVTHSKVFELVLKYSKLFPECNINQCACYHELKKMTKTQKS